MYCFELLPNGVCLIGLELQLFSEIWLYESAECRCVVAFKYCRISFMSSSLCFFKPFFFKFEVVLLVQGVARSGTTNSPCKLRESFSRLTASSRQTAEYNVLNINLFPEAIETK